MLAEDRVDDLRDDRVVVPDDTRKEGLAASQARDQILAHLLLDGAAAVALFTKRTDSFGSTHNYPYGKERTGIVARGPL